MGAVTNNPVHYLGVKECPFSIRGQNLVGLRRARLRPIAKALEVDPNGTKQEILKRIIAKLKAQESEPELDKNWSDSE